MIKVTKGNIFDSNDEVLVNEVSCDGKINNWLSYEFRLRNGYMYLDYLDWCKDKILKIGYPVLYRDKCSKVLCFPTKNSFDDSANIENIEKGLMYVRDNFQNMHIETVSFPMLYVKDEDISCESFLECINKIFNEIQGINITVYRDHVASRDRELVSFLDYVKNGGSLDGVRAIEHNRLANIISEFYDRIYSLSDILKYYQNVDVFSGFKGKQYVLEEDLVQAFASFREKTS